MMEKTVREIGGEIWSEMTQEMNSGKPTPLTSLSQNALNRIVDVITGVLARYENVQIVNDKDLPVTPLPRGFPDDEA